MKTCAKCGETKPLEDFHKEKRRKDGRTSRCRDCINAYMRSRHTPTKREKSPPAPARRYRLKSTGEESGQDLNAYMREYRNRPDVRERELCRDRLYKRIKRYRAHFIESDGDCRFPTDFLYSAPCLATYCELCGKRISTIHCHHMDFDRPFYFISLCSCCHGKVQSGDLEIPSSLLVSAEMTERHMHDRQRLGTPAYVEMVTHANARYIRAKSLESSCRV